MSNTKRKFTFTVSQLARDCGHDNVAEFLEEECSDSVVWGLCTRCGYAEQDLEPDGCGECPDCGSAYRSVLLLMGLI